MKTVQKIFICFARAFLLFIIASDVKSQNLVLNHGFDYGIRAPDGWIIEGCPGEWSLGDFYDKMVSVLGNGKNSGVWRTRPLNIIPGNIYHFIFYGKREVGTTGGSAVSGTATVNRDFMLSDKWTCYDFFFRAPENASNDYARVGQWEVMGRLYFDEVKLYPAMAVHKKITDDIELGEGELIKDGKYYFKANYNWKGANYHRPLYECTAGFNSDRLIFSKDRYLIYRFNIGKTLQTHATIEVSVNHYTAGALEIAGSKDGKQWTPLVQLDGKNRSCNLPLPDNLFPANTIFIKLSFAGDNGALQVNNVRYTADLRKNIPNIIGETALMDIQQSTTNFTARFINYFYNRNRRRWQFDFDLTTPGTNGTINVLAEVINKLNKKSASPTRQFTVNKSAKVSLYATANESGSQVFQIVMREPNGKTLFCGETELHIPFLNDPRMGYLLTKKDSLTVWWCESAWKVGIDSGIPYENSSKISVSLARHEYEPVQLILTPKKDCRLLSVDVVFPDFANKNPPAQVTINEVAYVYVSWPTDGSCLPGFYPDPLPPLKMPIDLKPNLNFPIWITFYAPAVASSGTYNARVIVKTSDQQINVPVELKIFDFTLPEETHLRSGFGLSTGSINQYHHLTKQEDKEIVYEKYLQNFARHRISPYSFFAYSPIRVSFIGDKTNKTAVVDFSKFDIAAEKWLDTYKFNAYRLPLTGMGGGTFHERYYGALEGFKEGTPEYMRLFCDYLGKIENHLRQRGWLDKAYTYWFDEPDRKDYEFVVEGMKRIKTCAPGLKRLLTEQPEPELIGHVDIWCGLTPEWTKERVRNRTEAGEEVWWYICCAPKSPYITEFIDHPGTELRLWPWQSWQYGVQGILVWETTYWTSSLVYSNSLQNPWEDPMSYVSGYGNPVGFVAPWGNGDGRFLYPPRRDPNVDKSPSLEPPIDSIRWENLRDGIEDYEYLWLLKQHIQRLTRKNIKHPLIEKAIQMLEVPENISKDLTTFTTDPRTLLEHRKKIARLIEQLQKM